MPKAQDRPDGESCKDGKTNDATEGPAAAGQQEYKYISEDVCEYVYDYDYDMNTNTLQMKLTALQKKLKALCWV